MLGRTRKLTSLRKGDIININVPYEENTRDYYNGYKPEEIRGEPFVDRFGKSSKTRMVIYIGRDGDTMLYLPLTSKSKSSDLMHQYELKDNSMTPHSDPDRRSYVEVEALRAIHISYHRDIPYTGRIKKEDLFNILHRISNTTLQFNSKRDQRGYIPDTMVEAFETELLWRGYELQSDSEYQRTYAKGTGQVITRTKYGMVHYHVSMTKEKVREIVSKREGCELGKQNKNIVKTETNHKARVSERENESMSFSDTVSQLSNQKQKGRGVYVNTC